MINVEWLKNINSILSQVIELSDNNPSFGKWLEFADRAAKQFTNSLSTPYMAPFVEDKPENDQSYDHTSASNSNATLNPLKLLEMVNNGFKQFSVLEPFLKNFMKTEPVAGESGKSSSTGSQNNSSGRPFNNNPFVSPLLGMLLPVLLAVVFLRFR